MSSPVEAGATEPDATAARAEPDQSKLQHLPPLCLHLRFPPHYPGSGPPEFSVSALWLSGVGAASLAVALQGLWDEQVRHHHFSPPHHETIHTPDIV